MQKLIPGFDVFPHGVKEVTKNGRTEIHAVFKLVLAIQEMNSFRKGCMRGNDKWNQFIKDANAFNWTYGFSNNVLTLTRSNMKPLPSPIEFHIPAVSGKCDDNPKPRFGYYLENGKYKDSWIFTDTDIDLVVSDTTNNKPIRQFISDKEKGGSVMKQHLMNSRNDDGRRAPEEKVYDPFTPVLRDGNLQGTTFISRLRTRREDMRAQSYDSRGEGSTPAKAVYDFRAIFGSFLKEPVVAEHRMGLVREFSIPFRILLNGGAKANYRIEIYEDKHAATEDCYLAWKRGDKYYNGLKDYFIKDTFMGKQPFSEVSVANIDPYKDRLEGEADDRPHPDGIYVLAKYFTDKDGKIIDPFVSDYFNGFNVVVKDENVFSSPSLHKRVVHLKGCTSIEVPRTSGVLTARNELVTPKERYRNNILISWRGDNLLVNRNDVFEQDDESSQMDHVTAQPTSGTNEEDVYITDNLYHTHESLIEGSMPQLISQNKELGIILRPTSPLHYCMPIKDELEKWQMPYTLTVEEAYEKGDEIDVTEFDVRMANKLAIKSVSIVGPKKYDKGNENVDNETHMVLDKFGHEEAERRFIFPPRIKWGDFRYLGYLTKERIVRFKDEVINSNIFADRCIYLEEKSEHKTPVCSIGREFVNYVADPRATELYIVGADLFTINKFGPLLSSDAFKVTHNFPFFAGTRSSAISVVNNGSTSSIVLNGNPIFKNLECGEYNFKVYAVDKRFTGSGHKGLKICLYNSVTLKVSILDKPMKAEFKEHAMPALAVAERVMPSESHGDMQRLGQWLLPLPLNHESHTWKSIKYLEENTVMKLPQDGFKSMYREYMQQNAGPNYDLLNSEYPYEMFLTKEGSLQAKTGLRTDIFPRVVTIDISVGKGVAASIGEHELFTLRLNKEELLVAKIAGGQIDFSVKNNDKGNKARFVTAKALTGDTTPDKVKLRIYYDLTEGSHRRYNYVLDVVDHKIIPLSNYISPEIGINDIEISEQVLNFIRHDKETYIRLSRSEEYQVVGDLRSAYYCRKKIRLFSSSPFQAYYPKLSSEFPLGTLGAVADIEIPNNTKPTVPKIDAKILFKQKKADCWDASGVKQNISEQLVQLLIDEEFCKEGPNKLGIVLAKYKDGKPLLNDNNMSEIGEDITKLTETYWSDRRIGDLINLSAQPKVIDKYYPDKQTKFYRIEGECYEVLEVVPFYNSNLKKWQIIVPLRFFERSETIFIKFITVKIARGHSLILEKPGQPNSSLNPFIDTEQTNLSDLSKPAQLPVYSRKVISVTKSPDKFKVAIHSKSDFEDKVYCVMLFKKIPDGTILNYISKNENERHQDLVSFKCADAERSPGKILVFSRKREVEIFRTHCACIVVLEFESHENLSKEFSDVLIGKLMFIDVNPLFEIRGLRLINAEEFIV